MIRKKEVIRKGDADMADPRRWGDRCPLAAGPVPRNRRAAGRRGAGGPCRRGRPAARPGRPALQGALPGARPGPALGPAGGARLRRLGPPGAAAFAAGPGRLRAGLRPAAGPAMGRGVRGGGAARVRVAPGARRHDPPRHPAAARAGKGRAMGDCGTASTCCRRAGASSPAPPRRTCSRRSCSA